MFCQLLREKRKEKRLSQEELSELLGITQACLSKWEKGKGNPTIENLLKLNEIFNINFLDPDGAAPKLNLTDDIVNIKFHENIRASAGDGTGCFCENYELVPISKKLLSPKIDPDKHYAIRVFGDSMYPTLNDGDILFVEHFKEFANNKIYIFKREDEIFVKRIKKSGNMLEIISDNQDYEPYTVDSNEITIIAKAV